MTCKGVPSRLALINRDVNVGKKKFKFEMKIMELKVAWKLLL